VAGSSQTRSRPLAGEVWLSCPPYLLLARITAVDRRTDPVLFSYQLHDEHGSLLEEVNHAPLDRCWLEAFRPLTRRYG
jgi:hypothetical protein